VAKNSSSTQSNLASATRKSLFLTRTVYTLPTDTWQSLQYDTSLSKDELIALNPHLADVEIIEAGIPVDIPAASKAKMFSARTIAGMTAFEVAKVELAIGVKEVPGRRNNSRIVMYHSSTAGGAAPDEVAWCSSFVNWCVERSGQVGTNSKSARSWKSWGSRVSEANWRQGDIVVFWRDSPTSSNGHVGFLYSFDGPRPLVLGGNQGDKLCVDDPYPYSQILSVRR